VFLNKHKGPLRESKEVIAESEVESEAKSTEGDESKPHEGQNKEDKDFIDSKAQWVAYLKKNKTIPKVVVYDIHII
jgi:hypothetical protein